MSVDNVEHVDPLGDLIAGVNSATAELALVKTALQRQRRVVRFDIALSALGLTITALLFFVLNGQAAQRRHEKVTAHTAAVAQCKVTDDARAGIRLANDTTSGIFASLVPANASPATVALLHEVQAKYAAANAAIPDLDCTKVR